MNRIVRINPYSNSLLLKIVQMAWVALLKTGIRFCSCWVSARWYRLVRFLLDAAGFIFLRFPSWARKQGVDAAGMPALWIWPEGARTQGVVLYVHGGGYSLGSVYTHRQMAACISRYCNARVLFITYPMAPKHAYPAAFEHTVRAYEWLISQGHGGDDITVMGDSSGGGLALACIQSVRNRGLPLPRCGVFISPWTDLTCSGESMRTRSWADPLLSRRLILPFARLYATEAELASPGASPYFGDMRGLPRMLFMVGADEVLLDDSLRIAEKETDRPVLVEVWKHMFHVWPLLYAYAPFFRRAFAHIARFVNETR